MFPKPALPITVKPALLAVRERSRTFARKRSTRRWGAGILVFLMLFGLLGAFAAPPLIRSTAEHQLGTLLMRPVTIGALSLNPYTLALEVRGLHIAERDSAVEFVTLERLRVRPSWSSLFRLKPVIAEVFVDTLHVNVIRSAPGQFNFSDIAASFAKPEDATNPEQPAKPQLFAVSNIHVENTRIDFDDRLLDEKHRIDGLRIGIPFIANIPSQVDVFVQPLLEATVDGSRFAMTGQVKPFSPTLASTLDVKLDQLDLTGLLSYSPTALPVRLAKARLSTDLVVKFERDGEQPHVAISGTVDLGPLSITDAAGLPLFDAETIHVAAESVEPLKQIAHLSDLRIVRPVVSVSRDAGGALNLSRLDAQPTPAKAAKAAAVAVEKAAAELPDVSLGKFELVDGSLRFDDHAVTSKAVQIELKDIGMTAHELSTRAATPARYDLKAKLAQGGDLAGEGSLILSERKFDTKLTVDALSLPAFQPYLATLLTATPASGTLGLQMQAQVDAGDTTAAPVVRIGPGQIELQALKLIDGRKRAPVIELGRAIATIGLVDLAARSADLPSVDIGALNVNAERAADGILDLAGLVRPGKPDAAPPASSAKADAAWRYHIGSTSLNQANVNFVDNASSPAPVAIKLSGIVLKLGDLTEDARAAIPIDLSGTLQRKGRFAIRGTAAREPLQAALNVKGSDLDLVPVSPYFTAGVNVSIVSALMNLSGDLNLARTGDVLKTGYKGDLGFKDLRVIDRETLDGFLGFGELSLTKVKLGYDDKGPDIDIGRIVLGRFFAQVLLDAQGRLNLGRVIGKPAPSAGPVTAEASSAPTVVATVELPVTKATTGNAPMPMKLHIGEIRLASGSVDYTDNFIKPNFNANVTDIVGLIGAFGSELNEAAPIDIKAQLNSNGPVKISGSITPLAMPPSLDIKASASEIELTRFAAYSMKYTGYPIVKGKLQVDLNYALKDGQLRANNHIFIDQFTFGDRVESESATSLPVRLAVSLLKNSRGEIDINLPVSGSLSDPQFSVGGIIWHAFLNVIQKAVTSPFSLLANAFGGDGGGDDEALDSIGFAPGSAALDDAQAAKLDKLVKALADRPAIKLDLVGRADPALDTPALRQATVDRLVKQQRIKDVVGSGESIDLDQITIDDADYPKYLGRAYKAADIKKPTNVIGLAKSLPPEEMKAMLLDATTIGDGDLLSLAERRAAAVQRKLDGKVDAGRIFVVSPRLIEASEKQPEKDASPTTRVDFSFKD